MAGEKCSLTCNIKVTNPHTGREEVKVSALWEDLAKFFKGDRRNAITHYFLTKDSNFLRENSDVLEFDADGEVTIASLKKALERDGEYDNLSNARTLEHLNREIQAGRYNYSEALDNVLKFNKSSQFRDGFMATMKQEEDGKWLIEVVKRNPKSEYELADHLQKKLLTDAVRIALEQRGLSVEFLDNPSYAIKFSTQNVQMNADGLYAVASILDGQNSSREIAEVAGHFIAAAMQDSPLVQRLIATLTPEVQQAIFKTNKYNLQREDFIVSEESAREAAGILIGQQLLKPFEEAQRNKAATIGNAIPKSIMWLLNKLGNIIKRIFGIYKPDMVQKMVQQAKEQASTAANGFLLNPEEADVETAFRTPETYTSGSVSKHLSDEVRRNVNAYYDTLGNLKDIIFRLRTSIGRAESPTNRDIFNKLKTLAKGVASNYSPMMSLESFAKNASIEGMVVTLEGITHILDTDIRSLLDSIQPSNKVQSYVNISTNARNMRTVNTAIKNIAELYLTITDKLESLSAEESITYPDADGNMVAETLREALERLGNVLVGNEESFVDSKGEELKVKGLQEVMELKRRQIFMDAIQDFYGKDYVELSAGKVWQQRGARFKLVNSMNKKVAVQDFAASLEEDISWFDRYLSSAADCGDFVTAVGNKVTKAANMNADRLASHYWEELEGLRLQMQDVFGTTDCNFLFETTLDENNKVVKTGNLISRVNYGAWEIARHEYAKQLKKDFNEYLASTRKKAYENNKNVKSYTFTLTDEQRAVLYHTFVDPLWQKWHNEHSEKDPTAKGTKWLPNHTKYASAQWDEHFNDKIPGLSAEEVAERQKRQKWYNRLMEIKKEMDGLLPKNATTPVRAPQMVGRFSHRFRNLREKMGNSLPAFGTVLRRKAQEWVVVKPDEAYLFGSNNEFNEIEEDPMGNPMYFEKEKVNRLPLFGINKLKNMEDISTDLFGTLLQYGSMAATYNAMERVVDVFELGRDVLKQRKVGNKIEVHKAEETRAYSRYAKFIEKQIYGVNVTAPSWDKKGMWRKLASNLSSLGGRILLWGNVHGGIVNTGTGVFEIFKEALAGENFSMSDIVKAHEMYWSGLLDNWYQANRQRKDDKNSLWIRHWNILSENRAFLHNQIYDKRAMGLIDNRLWTFFGNTLMLPYSSGDHYMQTIPYYAMGNRMKVYDHEGNSMSLIDAYDIVDGEEVFAIEKEEGDRPLGNKPKKLKLKEGIFRTPADIDKYDTVVGMLNKTADFFESHSNIRNSATISLDFFNDEERAYLEKERFNIPETVKQLQTLQTTLNSKKRSLVFNEEDESAFMDKCRNITNRLHGIYNSEDKVTFQQNFYGNLVMAMRGYALGMVNRRYARSKFNVPQGKVVEGNFNTAFKVLLSGLFDIYNADNWKAVGEAFLLTTFTPLLFSKGYGERLRADMMKAGFSENQYYNMRRTGADFLVLEVLALTKLLAAPGGYFGLNDDDEGDSDDTNIVAGLLYYFSMRWFREQAAFDTLSGMENEATSLLDYTPVGFSGMTSILNIAKLFVETQMDKASGNPDLDNSDLYYQSSKEGVYTEGDEKWKIKFLKLCPYIRSFYTFSHPYDAAAGYQYGRRIRGN